MEIFIQHQKQSEENFMKHDERQRQEEREHEERIMKMLLMAMQPQPMYYSQPPNMVECSYQSPHDQFN